MTLLTPSPNIVVPAKELRRRGFAPTPLPTDSRWLVRLRWAAIFGQLATLAALWLIGAADLRLGPLLGVEALIVASNAALWIFARRRVLRGRRLIGPVLVADTFLLTALLAFSGGPMNPFTIFFLVHVVMAAVLLGGRWSWMLAGLCGACYGSLFLITPVTPHMMHGREIAGHLYGMLSSFVTASVCVSYFVSLVQRQRRAAEMRAAEAMAAAGRAESFAALTAVAAGAAHELATPLGTIAVAARELERSAAAAPDGHGLAQDARLIREEVDRCRRILDALSPRFPGGDQAAPLAPEEMIAGLLERLGATARRRVRVESVGGAAVRLPRQRAAQAAAALLQNALDAAAGPVAVSCRGEPDAFTFRVADDGPGMSAAVQGRLGEPFFTTKPHGRGLGLFLVRQFVEQSAGRLVIDSREGAGTRVTMVLPPQEDA